MFPLAVVLLHIIVSMGSGQSWNETYGDRTGTEQLFVSFLS